MFNRGKCTSLFLFSLLCVLLLSCFGPAKLSESRAQALATAYLKPFTPLSFAKAKLESHPLNYPGYRYYCVLTVSDTNGEKYTIPVNFYYQYDTASSQFFIDKTAGSLMELYKKRAQRHYRQSKPHSTLKHVQSWEMH